MNITPYLSFQGRCDEAIEFYKSALGAEVISVHRFKEMPPSSSPEGRITPGMEDKVMHAAIRIGDSTMFLTDARNTGQLKFDGTSLCITAANDAQAAKIFNALSNGGKISMPMGKTFFASSFGMATDRFGVPWMVIAGMNRD